MSNKISDATFGSHERLECMTRDLTQSEQSWYLTGTYRLDDGIILRVRVRRNAYDFQSYAIVEAFSNLRWNEVATIPTPKMASLRVAYFKHDLSRDDRIAFTTDESELLRRAIEVVGA